VDARGPADVRTTFALERGALDPPSSRDAGVPPAKVIGAGVASPTARRQVRSIGAPSVDDFDRDFAFESLELIERCVIGAEMDCVVRVADPLGVVVEAEVAPGDEVDQVTALRVGAGRAAVPELSRQVADLFSPGELLEGDRQGSIERKSRTAGLSSPMVTSTEVVFDENRTVVPPISPVSLSAVVVAG